MMRQRLEAATAEKLFKFSKLFDFPTPYAELQMEEMEHVIQTRSVRQGNCCLKNQLIDNKLH